MEVTHFFGLCSMFNFYVCIHCPKDTFGFNKFMVYHSKITLCMLRLLY